MKYQDIGFEEISLIKNVWEKNRDYHRDISEHFSNDYVGLCFEERMQFLGDIDKENVKITIAEKIMKYLDIVFLVVKQIKVSYYHYTFLNQREAKE